MIGSPIKKKGRIEQSQLIQTVKDEPSKQPVRNVRLCVQGELIQSGFREIIVQLNIPFECSNLLLKMLSNSGNAHGTLICFACCQTKRPGLTSQRKQIENELFPLQTEFYFYLFYISQKNFEWII